MYSPSLFIQMENSWRRPTVLKFVNVHESYQFKKIVKIRKNSFMHILTWTQFWTLSLQVSSLHFVFELSDRHFVKPMSALLTLHLQWSRSRTSTVKYSVINNPLNTRIRYIAENSLAHLCKVENSPDNVSCSLQRASADRETRRGDDRTITISHRYNTPVNFTSQINNGSHLVNGVAN